MAQSSSRSIGALFFTLVVVMLGFGVVIPIIPFYVEHLGAGGWALGVLMAIFSLMQLICAPVWGSLSDRIGRKPVLMIGIVGNSLSMVLFGLSTELWMLFASRALAGVLSSATMPTAMAYIGDTTSDRERGKGMGMMGAAMGLGMVLGPGFGGWLAGVSLATPFFASAALSLFSLIPVARLPESLSSDRSGQASRGARHGGQTNLLRVLSGPLGIMMLMAFLVNFGLAAFQGIFGLFALERFSYGPQQVGLILMVFGLVSAAMQGLLTGRLVQRWGEVRLVKVSLLASAVAYITMLLAIDFATVALTSAFFALGTAMLLPGVAALTSRRATIGQGVAMGLSNSFMSLGRTIGPLWAGFIFDVNVDYPYISGAIVMLVGFLVSAVWLLEQDVPSPAGPPLEARPDSPPVMQPRKAQSLGGGTE